MSAGFKVTLAIIGIIAAIGFYLMNRDPADVSAQEEARIAASLKSVRKKGSTEPLPEASALAADPNAPLSEAAQPAPAAPAPAHP